MRTKRYFAQIDVSRQFLVEGGDEVKSFVEKALERPLSGALVGPRGGRYEPIGDIRFIGAEEDFPRDMFTFRAERLARYVRPKR